MNAMEYNPAKWIREQPDEKLKKIFEEWQTGQTTLGAAQEQVRLLTYELQEATRICDQPGCISAVIRLNDGRRVCAQKHESRWVDKAELADLRNQLAAEWQRAGNAEAERDRAAQALLDIWETLPNKPHKGIPHRYELVAEVVKAAEAELREENDNLLAALEEQQQITLGWQEAAHFEQHLQNLERAKRAEAECDKLAAKLKAVMDEYIDLSGRIMAFDIWGIEGKLAKPEKKAWRELADIADKVVSAAKEVAE